MRHEPPSERIGSSAKIDVLAPTLDAASKPGAPSPQDEAAALPARYEQAEVIGRGGFGTVYQVYDRHLERVVALKQLRTDREGAPPSAALASRFEREAKITGQLEHPAIVPVYEFERGDGAPNIPYYVMRKVAGQTLESALAATSTLAERLHFLPAFLHACHAVAYAHEVGIIHRDLKPDNIMVGDFGRTQVLDWGLAKRTRDDDPATDDDGGDVLAPRKPNDLASVSGGPGTPAVTHDGSTFGTPSYMPPEQCLGLLDEIDARSDVYALGAILFRMIAGRPPVEGPTVSEIVAQTVAGNVAPPVTYAPDAPPELSAIAMRSLRPVPDDRYPSARELADDVSAFLDGGLVGAHRYRPRQLLARWVRRRWPWLVAMTVAIASVAGAAALRRREIRADQAEREARAAAEASMHRERVGQEVDTLLRDAAAGAAEPRWLQTYAFRIVALDDPVAREAIVPRLAEALDHEEPNVRRLAARACSGIITEATLEALVQRLPRETEEPVVVEIIHSLGVHGDPRAQAPVSAVRWKAGQNSRLWDQTELPYRMIPLPAPDPDMSAEAWVVRGRALSNKGDPDGAIEAYSRALAIDPKFAKARNNRAIEYSRKERFDEARDDYDVAIAADPTAPKPRFNRAAVKRRLGDYAGAIADYTALIEADVLKTNALRNRAFVYRWAGDADRALADYETVIALQPEHPRAYRSLGTTYLDIHRWDDAIPAFDAALSRNPDFVSALVGRALAHRQRGAFDLAAADYDRALQTDPAYQPARIGRAALRLENGDEDGALRDISHCLVAKCPRRRDHASHRHAARAILGHLLPGRRQDALEELELAYQTARKPSDAANAVIWGLVLAGRNGGEDEVAARWQDRRDEVITGASSSSSRRWHEDAMAVVRGDLAPEALARRTPGPFLQCAYRLAAGLHEARVVGDAAAAHEHFAAAADVKRPLDLSCMVAAWRARRAGPDAAASP
ncbi:MAG: tetratricopeptide repeat protein [Myxococcota bacterium]